MPPEFRTLDDPRFEGRVKRLQGWTAETYRRAPPDRVLYFADAARERHAGTWNRLDERLPAGSLWRIRDAVVRGKGIITLDGDVVRNNLEGITPPQVIELLRGECAPARRIHDPVLHTTRYGIKNYGHCLTDVLPRTAWAHVHTPQAQVLLHAEAPAPMTTAMAWSGLRPQEFLRVSDEALRFDELLFVDLWNRHPLAHSPRILAFLRAMASRSGDRGLLPPAPARRLFVGREDARTRRLTNTDQVSGHMAHRGFEEIRCGGLSLGEQIAAFDTATEVVGIAGAALTNLVFCRPGTRVTLLAPETMNAGYFWDLAHQAGLPFRIGYFPARNPERGIHADFEARPDQIDALLEP